jgi:hypothetical protein
MKYAIAFACLTLVALPSLARADDGTLTPLAPATCPPCPVCAATALPEPPTEMRSPGQVGGGLGLVVLGLGGMAGGAGLVFGGMVESGADNFVPNAGGSGPHPGLSVLGGFVIGGGVATVVTGVWMIARGAHGVPLQPSPRRDAVTFDPTRLAVRF